MKGIVRFLVRDSLMILAATAWPPSGRLIVDSFYYEAIRFDCRRNSAIARRNRAFVVQEIEAVLRQKLNPDVLMMQSAENWDSGDVSALVPAAELWSILLQ